MRVLVTGGSGTFGRAFIRRFVRRADAVVSFSRDEQKAAALVEEFKDAKPFKAFLGDVRDRERLKMAMSGVDVVVHAAALKRIDVGAYSPGELVQTNIFGTMNVVNAAIEAHVRSVVVISSDKAVAPTNLYGATKLCAETYAVQSNAYGYPKGTKISCVRYGNIIGSRGSVYHIWKKQAEAGERLTMTDPNMTRFVMTIEEAVDLVDFAITHAEGGEVFLPMLPACAMGTFAGAVAPNHEWEIIGRRPGGEKDHESLLNEEEIFRTRYADGIYLAVLPTHREWTSEEYRWARPFDRDRLQSNDPAYWAGLEKLREMLASTEACR